MGSAFRKPVAEGTKSLVNRKELSTTTETLDISGSLQGHAGDDRRIRDTGGIFGRSASANLVEKRLRSDSSTANTELSFASMSPDGLQLPTVPPLPSQLSTDSTLNSDIRQTSFLATSGTFSELNDSGTNPVDRFMESRSKDLSHSGMQPLHHMDKALWIHGDGQSLTLEGTKRLARLKRARRDLRMESSGLDTILLNSRGQKSAASGRNGHYPPYVSDELARRVDSLVQKVCHMPMFHPWCVHSAVHEF